MAQMGTLERRVRALLDPLAARMRVSRAGVFAVAVAALVVVAGVSTFRLSAGPGEGGFQGVVKDARGKGIADAKVRVKFLEFPRAGREEVTRTNENGEFAFPVLPVDGYGLAVEKEGYATAQHAPIRLSGEGMGSLQVTLYDLPAHWKRPEGAPPPPLPPPPPAQMLERNRVSANVMANRLASQAAPNYPADCKAEGVSGIVLLRVTIDKAGLVSSARAINEFVDARLRDAALTAVRKWRYTPLELPGRGPVDVETEVEVSFALARMAR
jgi:TonB family protein